MRLPSLAGVVLAAAAVAAPAWGQLEGRQKKTPVNSIGEGGELSDEAESAMLKKVFQYCKETGDCAPYFNEKEKRLSQAPNAAPEPARLSPRKPPPTARTSPARRPRGEALPGKNMPEEPSLPPGAPVGQAMGEPTWAPPPTVERAALMREDAEERRERTLSRAAGAADTMRRSFLPADETAGPGPAGPEGRGAAASEEARTDPAAIEPGTVAEMALAAREGYAATFRDQGLKVGAGPRGEPAILRADGAAASPADLARLKTALSSEPAALRRRPDFFEVLPREKFSDLKQDYAARPELRATVFRDIGMTARNRDFQWSASCSGLSGACNPYVAQRSYHRGQDVPPEALAAVWTAAQEEIIAADADEDADEGADEGADEDDGWGEYTEEDRRLAAAEDLAEEMLARGRARGPNLGSLLARMGELAREVGTAAGWAPATARDGVAHAGFVAGPVGEKAPINDSGAGAAATGRPSAVVPGPPPAPEGRRAANRNWFYLPAAAGVAGLLFFGLRRKSG